MVVAQFGSGSAVGTLHPNCCTSYLCSCLYEWDCKSTVKSWAKLSIIAKYIYANSDNIFAYILDSRLLEFS